MNINAAIKIFLKIIAPVRYIVEKIVYKFFLNRYNNWDLLEKYKHQTINIIANGPSLNKTNFKYYINENFIDHHFISRYSWKTS